MDGFRDRTLKTRFANALQSLQNDPDITLFSLDTKGAALFSQLKLTYKNSTGIKSTEAKKNDLDLLKFRWENWLNYPVLH
jgi:hypothetical protein